MKADGFSFFFSSSRHVCILLEPAYFTYPQNFTHNLEALDKTKPWAIKDSKAMLPGSFWGPETFQWRTSVLLRVLSAEHARAPSVIPLSGEFLWIFPFCESPILLSLMPWVRDSPKTCSALLPSSVLWFLSLSWSPLKFWNWPYIGQHLAILNIKQGLKVAILFLKFFLFLFFFLN